MTNHEAGGSQAVDSDSSVYLVLIETSGNQAYIYNTNKLREHVGASELTVRIGTEWVLEAIEQMDGPKFKTEYNTKLKSNESSDALRQVLLDTELNKPITDNGTQFEIMVAVSGKAVVLVKGEEKAKTLVEKITLRALKEAPGTDVRGAVVKFDPETDNIHVKLGEAFGKLFDLSDTLPGPALRYLRLPIVESCSADDGMPAMKKDDTPHVDNHPVSMVSICKREATKAGLDRIKKLVDKDKDKDKDRVEQVPTDALASVVDKDKDREGIVVPETIDKLEDFGSDWFGIMHADGNGIGQVFIDFDKKIKVDGNDFDGCGADKSAWNREYIQKNRLFSLALEYTTRQAFCKALDESAQAIQKEKSADRKKFHIFPLVLGGDDLTVVCDGRHIMRFAERFCRVYQEQTQKTDLPNGMDNIIVEMMGEDGVTMGVGVAIIKPHYPFHAGYELTEALLRSAKKKKKKPESAIDFHVLYDSSSDQLEGIRSRMKVDAGKTVLTARPYILTPGSPAPGSVTPGSPAPGSVDPGSADSGSADPGTPDSGSADPGSAAPGTPAPGSAPASGSAGVGTFARLQACVELINKRDNNGRRLLPNSQVHRLRAALFKGHEVADAEYKLVRDRYGSIKDLELDYGSLFEEQTNGEASDRVTDLLDAVELYEFWY